MRSLKATKLLAIIFSIVFLTNSCSKKDGDWDDIIELSQKEVRFNSTADSITITTKGDSWWISDIRLNDEQIIFESQKTIQPIFEIIETEFVISRRGGTELKIKIAENPTVDQRELIIGLQAGNYFDNIKVIQEGN